jgi:PAS domain S-box-containing protein
MAEQGLRAGIFVPLVAHGGLQGGLILGWRDPALLADEHVTIAGEVADQLAIAILHADAYERLERSAARLALVHEIDRAVLSAHDTGEIAARAIAQLRQLAGAERVAVMRYDLERGIARVLGFEQAGGGGAFGAGSEVPLAIALPPAMREGRQPYLIPDMAATVDELPGIRDAVANGMRAAALVPLVAGDTLVGAISLTGRDDRVLQEENVAVAMEVADQLVIAILEADSRARLERTNDHLALLHEIDLAILASESPEDLAARVASPLARLARARRLDISAYDLATDEGRVLAFAHDGSSQATPVGTVYPLGTSVPMAWAEAPELMVFDDIPRLADDVPLIRSAVAAGLAYGMWIPLVAAGRLLGAIGMAGDDPLMTSPEIVELARAMGDQLAVALQHAEDRSQLAEREHRLAAILGASPNGILAVDAAGLISYANPAAHHLFRAPDGALVGLRHATLVPPGVADVHPVQVAEWFVDPDPATTHPLDTEAVRLDGTTFPVHVLLARVDTATGPLAIATVVDLSERTALEGRLRQAERLETLGQFAGILAHDVRNYLTAIAWSAELLESEMTDDDPRAGEVGMIRKATQDAIDMTRTVLEFARPTGDPTGVLDVAAHLSGTRSMLTRILGEGVRLELEADADLPPAGINATALTQVLGNLASNARDAMPDGGAVRITAQRHEAHGGGPDAGGLEPGRYIRLRVVDTGVGMDEDTRRRAFDAFYTTKTMASTARGTGLGLSSVFLIVTKAGGSVHVESVPGQGTTFTVDLPEVRPA